MKKYLLFIVFLVVILILWALFFITRNQTGTTVPPSSTPIPTQPTPLPQGAVPNNYTGDKNIAEKNRRSYVVGQLIDKLPHQETHMTLSYDIDKNIFTAAIDSSDKNKGLAQLDAVLKANGIESISWIENLEIVYQ